MSIVFFRRVAFESDVVVFRDQGNSAASLPFKSTRLKGIGTQSVKSGTRSVRSGTRFVHSGTRFVHSGTRFISSGTRLKSTNSTRSLSEYMKARPDLFIYQKDDKFLERAIAVGISGLQIVAGIVLVVVTKGALYFVGQELISSGVASLLYTYRAGSNFNWESYLKGQAVGLMVGAVSQGCCVAVDTLSSVVMAKHAVRHMTHVVREVGNSVRTDLIEDRLAFNSRQFAKNLLQKLVGVSMAPVVVVGGASVKSSLMSSRVTREVVEEILD